MKKNNSLDDNPNYSKMETEYCTKEFFGDAVITTYKTHGRISSNQKWTEKRVQDIWEVICELEVNKIPVPKEWIAELQTHISRLKNDITVAVWREQIYSNVEDYVFKKNHKNMSNKPNKIAWKGTPGPWNYKNDGTYHGLTANDGNEIIGYFGLMTSMSEENEANSYMASAAPEAIEFIADLLQAYDDGLSISEFKRDFYEQAESILKKAYNH